jgi:hypothetical protein
MAKAVTKETTTYDLQFLDEEQLPPREGGRAPSPEVRRLMDVIREMQTGAVKSLLLPPGTEAEDWVRRIRSAASAAGRKVRIRTDKRQGKIYFSAV